MLNEAAKVMRVLPSDPPPQETISPAALLDSKPTTVGGAIDIRALTQAVRRGDEARLWAWLARLARNAFIDHCRAERRRDPNVSLEGLPRDLLEAEPSEHRLSASLREMLGQLPPDDGELLQAAYVDERPLQELADEWGQTYKAVECRLARIRQRVKERLLKDLRHESES